MQNAFCVKTIIIFISGKNNLPDKFRKYDSSLNGNQKSGRYYTLDMLRDEERLKEACDSEEEIAAVLDVIRLLHE